MSESEERKLSIEFPKFDELDATIRRAMRQLEVWRERAAASETERRRLQEQLERLQGVSTELEPSALAAELERLRLDNRLLRERLDLARRQAEELAHDVQFLEDAR